MTTQISRRSLFVGAASVPVAFALSGRGTDASAGTSRRMRTRGGVGERLRDLERSYQGRIGAFGLDTADGATVGYRSGERFPLCSTFKAFAASAVLCKARESDPGLLRRVIHYSEEDLVEYSPVTSKHVDSGLSVARLCAAAIAMSDNTAGNLLLRQIGGPTGLTGFWRTLGDPATRLDGWEPELNVWEPGRQRDTTMPELIGRDLAALAHGDTLHRTDRERLNGWLRAATTGEERIRAGLPQNWTVGDKTGTSVGNYAAANDIAIAWPPESSPIVLAIYTNRTEKEAEPEDAVIAETATVLARALGKID